MCFTILVREELVSIAKIKRIRMWITDADNFPSSSRFDVKYINFSLYSLFIPFQRLKKTLFFQ